MDNSAMKGQSGGSRSGRMETMALTPELVKSWKAPPFQRPLKINTKVRSIAEEIADTGVVPGVITLGIFNGDTYIVDGQHRRQSFLLSGAAEVFADVRTIVYDNMVQMSNEFMDINSKLVSLKPDDILRGLESSIPALKIIRERCTFVRYGSISRASNSNGGSLLSMSVVLRSWTIAKLEAPRSSVRAAQKLAEEISPREAEEISDFLNCCFRAWGSDRQHNSLWAALNLTVVCWLYRRMVLDDAASTSRAIRVDRETFTKCIASLAASEAYLMYLPGQALNERSRSTCMKRIKEVISRRLSEMQGHKVKLPAPDWSL